MSIVARDLTRLRLRFNCGALVKIGFDETDELLTGQGLTLGC